MITMDTLPEMLEETGLKFAYHHWERPPTPPYGVYLDDYTDNYGADDGVYHPITHVRIEIYQLRRDRAVEKALENVLYQHEIWWDRETTYIESERLYQTTYEIEV
jgi:hypothetical protein